MNLLKNDEKVTIESDNDDFKEGIKKKLKSCMKKQQNSW